MRPLDTRPTQTSIEHDLDADLTAIAALERSIRVAQAEQLRLVARARERAALLDGVHDGSPWSDREFATRSFIAELATTLVVPEARASGRVGDAGRLADLPATAEAFANGDLGLAHVHTIMEVTSGASAEFAARLEREAIERAPRQTNASLRRSLRRLREPLEPQPLDERRAVAATDRRVCVDPAADGMAWLSVFMEAERAFAIKSRLDAIVAGAAEEPHTGDADVSGQANAEPVESSVAVPDLRTIRSASPTSPATCCWPAPSLAAPPAPSPRPARSCRASS